MSDKDGQRGWTSEVICESEAVYTLIHSRSLF